MLKTLDRGLQALWAISRQIGGITPGELAAELNVDRAIAYRIVATLEDHGLVARRPDGRLVLGAAVLALEARFAPQLRQQARPILDRLASDTRATAFISVAEGANCTAIMVSEPENVLLSVGYRVGSTHAIDRGAAGIAILSGRTGSSNDTRAVREARETGYSMTQGILQQGAIGVASPIFGPRSGPGALEACVGVVAMEDLDTDRATKKVMVAAKALADLTGASGV